MKYLLLLLLALPVGADILISDKPCLWKRPVTQWIQEYGPKVDTIYWTDRKFEFCTHRTKICNIPEQRWHESTVLDTVSWETYWDSCPKRKPFTQADIVNMLEEQPQQKRTK